MPSAEKVEKVAELKRRIEGSQALLLADFKGLSVTDAMDLRRSLGEAGARFSIVKNTLMKRAVGEAGLDAMDDLLEGPTAVAFVEGDAVLAAKRLAEAGRRFPDLVLKGAYMEGRVMAAADAQRLAALESRAVMLAKIAGLAKGEMSRAAAILQALQGRLLSLLGAYKDKLPEPPEAPEAKAAETQDAQAPREDSAPEVRDEEPEASADGETGEE